jgi:hypothetical protein
MIRTLFSYVAAFAVLQSIFVATSLGDNAYGFGSVRVNFQVPPGYQLGFRDYLNYLATTTIGTQGGPILYVGNYGATNQTGVLTTSTDSGNLSEFNLASERTDPNTSFGIQTVDLCNAFWLNDDDDQLANENRSFMLPQSGDHGTRHDIELTTAAAGPTRGLDESGDPQDEADLPPNLFASSNDRPNGIGIVYGFRALDASVAAGGDFFNAVFGRAS